jgi:HD-GYP domain-containing protein (c-di-GMP phosphodiesterase class II)
MYTSDSHRPLIIRLGEDAMQYPTSTHHQVFPDFSVERWENAAYENLKDAIASWHNVTLEHSISVRIHSTYLGIALGLSGKELTALSYGAELHDIGKLRIPKHILDKVEPLDSSDYNYIECHPVWGREIAITAFIKDSDVIACIHQHHEREDGSGYPNGLTSSQINPLAKIVAVADTFTALREERPYGEKMSDAQAMMVLLDDKSRFDPNVVRMLAHIVMHSRVSSGD